MQHGLESSNAFDGLMMGRPGRMIMKASGALRRVSEVKEDRASVWGDAADVATRGPIQASFGSPTRPRAIQPRFTRHVAEPEQRF